MERVTATFDAKMLAAIRKVAGPRGVSAFLQAAARERLARLQVLELLDELDAEHGAPTPAVVREVAAPRERRGPAPVLVEATTGDAGRDAEVNRVLGRLERAAAVLRAPDEATARHAGLLRFRARTDDGIDALVAAATASESTPTVVLTSDPDGLTRLLAGEPQVAVRRVRSVARRTS